MVKRVENNLIKELAESLSPIERKILPLIKEEASITKLCELSNLDETSVLRALEFLKNKSIISLSVAKKDIIDLGTNGIQYRKSGLPERRLINAIAEQNNLTLEEARKKSNLTENEFKAALGALKKKALVNIIAGKVVLSGTKEEISRKTLEEQFLEILPIALERLSPEQKYSLEKLKDRKEIIEMSSKSFIDFQLTDQGKELLKDSSNFKEDLLEAITPEIIASNSWKNKKFRRYDIKSPVPRLFGGKRHFVNQATDYARKIWSEMGFKEMPSSNMVQTGFWNFDALFTAQDHPVREIHDTFYIKDIKGNLPKDKKIVERVKQAHEKGIAGSKGWRYNFNEDDPKRVILRTHTTCLSANTLSRLANLKDKTGKFFAVGKCFRNETVDWGHLFEFNQTEGIVVDKNANFRHLLGYLKVFFAKMGYPEVKFVPSYFPYTEPSVEIYAFNKDKKVWMEVGGAGIFRPEVVIPLLGEYIPVLAWGPGFDRTIMEYYGIKDLREMYANDIDKLRNMKFWMK